ncbi:hypothetical protein [Eubacterium sp. F2]|uniref:hypothetical protein n=1 Tax=Eubacterium sp. F2 TaxID=3381348 RepID=UPI0039081417
MNNSVRTVTSLAQFLPHYLDLKGIVIMLAVAAAVVAPIVIILTAAGKRRTISAGDDWNLTVMSEAEFQRYEVRSLVERYYELTVSGMVFLLFTSLYFLMTYFGVGGQVWAKYSSYVLLLMIIIAVLLNAWLDHALIPLETLRPGEREALHMTGILYMLIIFAYIKFGYKNDNYDSIIQYFILLMIGRFVGFDTTISAMKKNFHNLINCLPLLAMALASTAVMVFVGFSIGYLMTPNGVVFNLFIAQLYLLIVMSVAYKISSNFWKKDGSEGTSSGSHSSGSGFSGGSTFRDRSSDSNSYGGSSRSEEPFRGRVYRGKHGR